MPACRPLSDAEVARVLLSFHGRFAARDRALFALGVLSGFRISELLSLRVRDVLQGGRLVEYVTVSRRSMKRKARSRTVALNLAAQQALKTWLEDLQARPTVGPDTYVFLSRNGVNQPISRRRALRLLQGRFRAVGLTGPLGTHSLRKTFAVGVHAQLGHDLRQTQEVLGHQDVSTTIRYLPVDQEKIDRAVRSLTLGGRPRVSPVRIAWLGSNGKAHHEAFGQER